MQMPPFEEERELPIVHEKGIDKGGGRGAPWRALKRAERARQAGSKSPTVVKVNKRGKNGVRPPRFT